MFEPKLVRDLMTVGVPTCKWDTPVQEIARFLLEHHVEAMCVLDAEGHGIGIVGEQELVSSYGTEDLDELKAEEVMSEGVPELGADIPLTVAAQMMKDKGIRIAYMMHNSALSFPLRTVRIHDTAGNMCRRRRFATQSPSTQRRVSCGST